MIGLTPVGNHKPADKNEPFRAGILIVFVDHTECVLLKFLKRGFRHCFVILYIDDLWIACDPLKNTLEINSLDLPENFNIAEFYADQGHIVVCGQHDKMNIGKNFSIEILTCVNIVKRILGIRLFWIWTPWQLYRFLIGTKHEWGIFHQVEAIQDENELDSDL